MPRPRPEFHSAHRHPPRMESGTAKNRHSPGTTVTARQSVPHGATENQCSPGPGQSETAKRDSSEAARSFVYHDPRGGNNPLWRAVGQIDREDSGKTTKGRGEREKMVDAGVKKGMDFSYISSGTERNWRERRETGSRNLRSDRAGEWWFQRKNRTGQSPHAGRSHRESSEEHIHIYRGNLTKAGSSRTRNSTSKTRSSSMPPMFGQAIGGLNYADIVNPSHATPPDAKVSSIDIPNHDTLSQDMQACKNVIQFSNTDVYPAKRHRGELPSTSSPLTCVPAQSNIYTQLIGLSGEINHSREGNSIDKLSEGDGNANVYWPYRSAAKCRDTVAKRDITKAKRIDRKTKGYKARGRSIKGRSLHRDNSRYLRVGETVYRIVTTATDGDSSNTSSNSLGSAASCSKRGGTHAYRVSDLDLSYDKFRDDHFRQLARYGRGVASSSTLDAYTPPVCGRGEIGREESEHSSSSTGRDRSRF